MMGCLLGLGLAGGVPFLLRRFDSSVVELSEFEGTLGINGIGLVPLSDPKELESLNRAPTVGASVPNALLENFRLIRSSILLNKSPKGDGRIIMLTSARPSEGKTTVSSNVAWAFSSLGEKTLLIDCDLRRGRVHEVIGASNAVGMTDLLTGRASLSECVQKVEAENLWAITRGKVVPGTTELLNSGVFEAILEELKKKYDRIILDTPPVLGLSETAFLQHHADGVAIIVRCGKTLRKDVGDAVQSLQKLGAHFYGFILNGVDFSKRVNQYYYYYYSASYYDANWDEIPAKKEN
jgi:capsular exopolysaccharide synthesis family protein